jgi:hypothetical protein
MKNEPWQSSFRGKNIVNLQYYDADTSPTPREEISSVVVEWRDGATAEAAAKDFIDLRHHLSKAFEGRASDGTILIDATSISKSMIAYVTGLLMRTGSVQGIDIFYRQMEYFYKGIPLKDIYVGSPEGREINDIEFEITAIPYVEGKYKSSLRRHIVLLAGLDFQRTLSKVRELEAASIDVIVETEALSAPASLQSFEDICRRMEVNADHISVVPRVGMLEAVSAIRSAVERGSDRGLQTFLVSSAGKPFSIASALQSVLESEAPLLSTIPDRVVFLDQQPIGPSYLYRLRDQTFLP